MTLLHSAPSTYAAGLMYLSLVKSVPYLEMQ